MAELEGAGEDARRRTVVYGTLRLRLDQYVWVKKVAAENGVTALDVIKIALDRLRESLEDGNG